MVTEGVKMQCIMSKIQNKSSCAQMLEQKLMIALIFRILFSFFPG